MGVIRGIDEAPVSAWLAAHVPGAVPPFSFALIAGGRSNLTYAVTDAAGRRVVLRRPPLGHVLATAHDMAREHRIISALVGTAVPVPTTFALCTDTDVNGAPFYVMSYVDGVVLDSPEKGAALPAAVRRDVAFDLVDVLAELHLVDVDAVGLGDLAKRTGYVERQLKRWSAQWRDSKTRELPAIEEVEAGLRARIPVQQAVTIAHGDYRFGNCLVDPAAGRLAGVLDWELCTLGDPLADVGYLRVYWTDPGDRRQPSQRPDGRRGLPLVRRAARPLRGPHRLRPLGHRLLRRVLVLAAGRHQRRGLRPLPPRRDGRRRGRHRHVPGRHRGARRARAGRRPPPRAPVDPPTASPGSGAAPSRWCDTAAPDAVDRARLTGLWRGSVSLVRHSRARRPDDARRRPGRPGSTASARGEGLFASGAVVGLAVGRPRHLRDEDHALGRLVAGQVLLDLGDDRRLVGRRSRR